MKKSFLTASLMSLAFQLSGQAVLEKEITTGIRLNLYSHVETANGDRIWFGTAYPPAFDSSMAVVIKTDSLLQVKWAKRYKSFHKDRFYTATLINGTIFVGGSLREDFNQVSGGCIISMDTSGTVNWHRVYSNSYDDNTIGIYEVQPNLMLVVIRRGVNNTPTKILLVDNAGTLNTLRTFSSGGISLMADAVADDGAGNFYLTGYYNSPSVQENVVYVLKITATGVNWFREYYVGRSATVSDITMTSSGIALAGTCTDISAPSTTNSIVMSLDTSGNIQWAHEIGQNLAYTESANGIFFNAAGNLVITGQSNTSQGFQAMQFSVDANGLPFAGRAYGASPYQVFTAAADVSGGRLLLTGTNTNGSYLAIADGAGSTSCPVLPLNLVSDTLTVTVSNPALTAGTLTVNPAVPALTVTPVSALSESILCAGWSSVPDEIESEVTVYPNPAAGYISLRNRYIEHQATRILVTDMQGHHVSASARISDGLAVLDVSDLPPGIYHAMLITGNGVFAARFSTFRF